MSATSLKISVPPSFSGPRDITVMVSSSMLVSEIIEEVIKIIDSEATVNPLDYGLYVEPINQWLYPYCTIFEYSQRLMNTNSIHFKRKHLRLMQVVFMNYVIGIECDPIHRVETVTYSVISRLKSYIRDLGERYANWSLVQKDRVHRGDSCLQNVFASGEAVPVVVLRREAETPTGQSSVLADVVPFLEAAMIRVAQLRDTEGIYRKPGLDSNVKAIDSYVRSKQWSNEDLIKYIEKQPPHDLASAMKLVLRKLQETIVPAWFNKYFQDILKTHDLDQFKVLLASLPTEHYNILKAICIHIGYVLEATQSNKMTVQSMGVCMSGSIFKNLEVGSGVIKEREQFQELVEMLLENRLYLFNIDNGDRKGFTNWTVIKPVYDESWLSKYFKPSVTPTNCQNIMEGIKCDSQIPAPSSPTFDDLMKGEFEL